MTEKSEEVAAKAECDDVEKKAAGNEELLPVLNDLDEAEKPNPLSPEILAQVVEKLQGLGLSTIGSGPVLHSRLSLFEKRKPGLKPEYALDYLIVIDFEATCYENKRAGTYEQEIIEFPAVLIDIRNRCVLDSFHRYCRPVKHRILSDFCKTLTGISQEQVDRADSFAVVLKEFEEWLIRYDLNRKTRWCVATDGSFDIGLFLSWQLKASQLSPPAYCKMFVHIPKLFQWIYLFNDSNKERAGMYGMLEHLGLQPEGRLHSGIDDARNLARICLQMIHDGVQFRPTDVAYFHEEDEKKREYCCKVVPLNKKKWVTMHKNTMSRMNFRK
ncbi:3'-5' exoribonuclease 1-like isoform X2 [Paramacrobiotus metropolitanus]|nr:3'-5' exoribonuclease 1-like isoform X2 [Paramacrobiotus metropolitanus]XP_055328734.1 3'-5' exoribonuclease 1-like isoform X2 [Paramacrobiotus metropolitanus]